MTAGSRNTNSSEAGNPNLDSPPHAPSLAPKPHQEPFSAANATTSVKKEVRLTVEFPLRENRNHPNDLAIYFKSLICVLLEAESTMAILNWENPTQNPIRNASNIGHREEDIKQYFKGSRVIQGRNKIQGYVKIETSVPFHETKGNARLYKWLMDNKVYVRQSTLSTHRHSNLGWVLYSHPEYTNFANATYDIRGQIKTKALEFEMIPHNIIHTNSEGIKMSTKALKIRTNYETREQVMKELLEAFKIENIDNLSAILNTKIFIMRYGMILIYN